MPHVFGKNNWFFEPGFTTGDICLYHGNVGLKDLLDELVLGGVHQLNDVCVQAVSVFLQESCKGGQ